jgi:hypothetical protein
MNSGYNGMSRELSSIVTIVHLQYQTNSCRTRKGYLQRAFSLDVPMVSSSAIIVAANSEQLMCSGFSLGETVCLGNFEFIADYFSSLSLLSGGAT